MTRRSKKFVGTFIGSMMTNLWVYDGSLDASQKVLTLDTEGPGMTGDGKIVKYQDVIEFKSDDQRTLTSRVQGEDGEWSRIHDGDLSPGEVAPAEAPPAQRGIGRASHSLNCSIGIGRLMQ